MSKRCVGVGIAGCGDLTRRAILPHLAEPDAREKVAVLGLCDINTDIARQAAESFGVPHVAGDFEELLELGGVELVIIATPVSAHAEQAVAALSRGKHLYLQKPIATTLHDADRVLAEAAQSGSRVVAAPVQRLCPVFGHIKEALRRGELGTVYWALTAAHWPFAPGLSASRWDWLKLPDAGPLRDTTIYSLTTLTDLFGPVRSVAAVSSQLAVPPQTGVRLADDNVLLALELDGGVLAFATGGFAWAGRIVPAGFLGIYGEGGTIETTQIDPATWYPTEVEIRTGSSPDQVQSRLFGYPMTEVPHLSGRHALLPEAQAYADIMHLVDAILQDTAPLATLEQARHVVEVIGLAHASAETGERIKTSTTFQPERGGCSL